MMTAIEDFYRSREILERILQFLGVPQGKLTNFEVDRHAPLADSIGLKKLAAAATAEYISAYGLRLLDTHRKDHASMKAFDLGWTLDSALDVHRSIWDRENTLAFIDMEYFCKAYPGEPFLKPERVFGVIEPAYQAVLDVFESYGISPLVTVTGQGYNFVIRIPKNSRIHGSLAALGCIEPTLQYDYDHPSASRGRSVPEEDGRAFDAVGKLMELLYHKVTDYRNEPPSSIPLVIGDISCSNEKREGISFDFSSYTHPLHKRSIRCPFSTYSKHMMKADIYGDLVAATTGPMFCVPRRTIEGALSVTEILGARRNTHAAGRLAREVTTRIPDQSKGVADMLHDYRKSTLYAFHREFDTVQHDDPARWPQGYDSFDLNSIAPCVAQALRRPNPFLLQPTNLQLVVRALLALGWHPKHIAGMIASKYMRDFGWEVNFMRYDPVRWANVWVRFYAGLVLCQTDDLQDFDCTSQQKRGEAWMGINYCPRPNCGFDLAQYRNLLGR